MDPISALPALAGLIEKGGVIALLLLVALVLGYEVRRLRKENGNVYRQRDRALLMVVKLKTVCESNKIVVDLSDVRDMIPNGAQGS